MQYEKAADIRDQITQLQNVQATQNIEGTRGDLDLMAVSTEHGHACVQILFVREFRRTWTQQIQPDQTAY
ncbi:UvrB/UvrC motif-containing protein [Luminiphilus sp.]|nr:UvrB/UvrC motif-containing protein [Luminiphilus sp.]